MTVSERMDWDKIYFVKLPPIYRETDDIYKEEIERLWWLLRNERAWETDVSFDRERDDKALCLLNMYANRRKEISKMIESYEKRRVYLASKFKKAYDEIYNRLLAKYDKRIDELEKGKEHCGKLKENSDNCIWKDLEKYRIGIEKKLYRSRYNMLKIKEQYANVVNSLPRSFKTGIFPKIRKGDIPGDDSEEGKRFTIWEEVERYRNRKQLEEEYYNKIMQIMFLRYGGKI